MLHTTHELLLGKDWASFLNEALSHTESIYEHLKIRKDSGVVIYPSQDKIYRAFKECPLDALKVIILGQDPYFSGQATGLAFDNYFVGNKISSPSLKNILKEMLKVPEPKWSKNKVSALEHLPKQGVLLLNSALTVEENLPKSHSTLWEPFTQEVIKALNTKDDLIWCLWGTDALNFKKYITNPTHHFVISSHPSPLSVNRYLQGYPPFEQSNPFNKINNLLKSKNLQEVEW